MFSPRPSTSASAHAARPTSPTSCSRPCAMNSEGTWRRNDDGGQTTDDLIRPLSFVVRRLLSPFQMALAAQGGEIDAGETGDGDKIERQISDEPYFRGAVFAFDCAQVATLAVDRHAELGSAAGVGKFHMHPAPINGLFHFLPGFLPLARFDRMLAC